MVRHATETPRPLRELNPEVPDGLQQILNGMLAKEPGQRYSTPERAAQALQAFQAAGSEPARVSEEGPQLRKYLTWLEMNRDDDKEAARGPDTPRPPGARDRAKKAHTTPPPKPAEGSPAPSRRHHSKKHKKHKHGAAPVAASTAAPATTPADIDVELVPASALSPAPAPAARRGFRLSNRDWLLLALGAFGVILAGAVGFVLANVFQ
jgi:serine/threonine-protein kinase